MDEDEAPRIHRAPDVVVPFDARRFFVSIEVDDADMQTVTYRIESWNGASTEQRVRMPRVEP